MLVQFRHGMIITWLVTMGHEHSLLLSVLTALLTSIRCMSNMDISCQVCSMESSCS